MTDITLQILISIASGRQHGYAVLRDLGLYPGTLYANIKRLLEDALIEEIGDDEERRRLYRVTPAGRKAAAAELARLEAILHSARGSGLTPKAPRNTA